MSGWLLIGFRPDGPLLDYPSVLTPFWRPLLVFQAVATKEMIAGAVKLYEDMDEWHGDVPNAPFTPDAFRFMQEVKRVRKDRE